MTHLISIGNSKGIRIPKALIDQSQLDGIELELKLTEEGLLIRPAKRKPREGWEDNLKKFGNKKSSVDFVANRFDDKDWEWPGL